MKKLICIFLLGLVVCAGCSVRHGDFTVLSNKLIRMSDFEVAKADRAKGIEGEDVQHIIFLFPVGSAPTLEGALDDALERGGGDLMTDAVASTYWFWIPYIYGQAAWKVKGDVVKTRMK